MLNIIFILFLFLLWIILLAIEALHFITSPAGYLFVVLSVAIWVYEDAKRLKKLDGIKPGELSPTLWAALSGLFWFLGFPIYLFKRKTYIERVSQNNRTFAAKQLLIRENHAQLFGCLLIFVLVLAVSIGILWLYVRSHGPIHLIPFM